MTIEELSEAFSYLQETLGIINNQNKIVFQNTEFSTAFLSKVGIITPGDLLSLGIDTSALQEIKALQQSLPDLVTEDNYQKFLAECAANRNKALEWMQAISESLPPVIEKLNALKSAGENSAINTTEIESLIAQLKKADFELKSNMTSPASCNAYVNGGFQELTQNLIGQCDQLSLTVKGAQSALLERYLTTPHLNSTWEQLRTQGFTNYANVPQEVIGA